MHPPPQHIKRGHFFKPIVLFELIFFFRLHIFNLIKNNSEVVTWGPLFDFTWNDPFSVKHFKLVDRKYTVYNMWTNFHMST